MAYSDTYVRINLIHSSSNVPDDIITIQKNFDTNDFEILYRDQNNGTPISHIVSGLYRARVIDYLYIVFKNQSLDEEGYKSIQLTLPALPRLIVSGDKFKDLYYREHFLEAVGTGLDLLENTTSIKRSKAQLDASLYETPIPMRRSTAPGVRPQHLYFDDE